MSESIYDKDWLKQFQDKWACSDKNHEKNITHIKCTENKCIYYGTYHVVDETNQYLKELRHSLKCINTNCKQIGIILGIDHVCTIKN